MIVEILALDRASVRRVDQDGHLHIEVANISKSNVCPYRGDEIPEWQTLGLDPDRVYQLYRPPEELAKAAPTFAGKPLLLRHIPVSADEHPHDDVVGAVGHDVRFESPYLKAPLTVWTALARAGIETGQQRELSSSYRYRAVMEPGEVGGVRFDGKMADLVGNHVMVCEKGRAGPDVFVGDSALILPPAPPTLSTPTTREDSAMATQTAALTRAGLLASGALRTYLRPKLAADATIDLAPVLAGVSAKTWKADKPRVAAALAEVAKGKLAADEDVADVVEEVLDQLDDVAEQLDDAADKVDEAAERIDEVADGTAAEPDAGADPDTADDEEGGIDAPTLDRVRDFLAGKLTDEDMAALEAIIGGGGEGAGVGTPTVPGVGAMDAARRVAQGRTSSRTQDQARRATTATGRQNAAPAAPTVTKAAMDAAIGAAVAVASRKAAQDAERATIARLNAIAEAREAVRPYVGTLPVAMDSADTIYRLALDAAKVDLAGVPASAYPALLKLVPKPGEAAPVRPTPAMDAAANSAAQDFHKRFPGAARIAKR